MEIVLCAGARNGIYILRVRVRGRVRFPRPPYSMENYDALIASFNVWRIQVDKSTPADLAAF